MTKADSFFVFLFSAILQSIGMAMAVHATSTVGLYVSGFLLGVGPSIVILSMFTLSTNYFGKIAYPMLMGVAGLFLSLVPAIGAVLTGVGYDHFGGYALAFYTESALCIMGCLMIPFARPPVRAIEELA